jgi:tetratricopeptide (TPR) repeat protein
MAEGEFALVSQAAETALQTSSEWIGDHDLYAVLADAAAQAGDAVALRRYAPLAEETAAHYGHTLYAAVAHRAWGVAHRLAGEVTKAETRLLRALELFRALDTRWQIGRTLFELGELALARSNTAMARDNYERALQAFLAVKAAPDEVRTRAVLERLRNPKANAPAS